MRRGFVLLAIAMLLTMPATVLAVEQFTATLTPEAEVPPATSEGSGTAMASISDDETEVTYEVSYQNLTGPAAAAHIHFGSEDVAGGVILPLAVGASPFSGTLTEADFTPLDGGPQTFAEALAAIRDGMTYINIHTEANPGGEIRGQLKLVPDTATEEPASSPAAGTPMMLLVLVGVVAFLIGLRRVSVRRA